MISRYCDIHKSPPTATVTTKTSNVPAAARSSVYLRAFSPAQLPLRGYVVLYPLDRHLHQVAKRRTKCHVPSRAAIFVHGGNAYHNGFSCMCQYETSRRVLDVVFEAAARVQDGRTSHSGEGGSVKRGPRGKGWVGGVSLGSIESLAARTKLAVKQADLRTINEG